MKSIIEYQSYRQYMQDFYDFKKRTSVFSWREFSKQAGFISPNYLKQVCERDANLSKAGIHKVAEAMGLEGLEATFFCQLPIFRTGLKYTKSPSSCQPIFHWSKVV